MRSGNYAHRSLLSISCEASFVINLGLLVLGCPARRWYFLCLLDNASFFFLGRTPLDSVSFINYNTSQALRHNPQPICGVAYTPSGQRGMNTVTPFVLRSAPKKELNATKKHI